MRKFLLSIFKMFFVLSFFFFCSVINVYAVTVINQGSVGNPGAPGNGCSVSPEGWQGCYGYLNPSNIAMPAGYRITFVHSDGSLLKNPVTGAYTHSVDILNANDKDQSGKTALQLLDSHGVLYPDGVTLMNEYLSIKNRVTVDNSSYPRYKYYKNETGFKNETAITFLNFNGIDSTKGDDVKKIIEGQAVPYDGPAPSNDLNKMKNDFLPKIENYIDRSDPAKGIYPEWYLYMDDTYKNFTRVNFVDLILYYNGYLNIGDVSATKTTLSSYSGSSLYSAFINKDDPIYMLIEPTYFITFNLDPPSVKRAKVYGTFSEYMSAIKSVNDKGASNGLSWGLINNLPKNHACDLNTSPSAGTLPLITKDPKKGGSVCPYVQATYSEAIDNSYGYGVFVVNVSANFKSCVPGEPDCPKPETECTGKFCANFCESNDGVLSFKSSRAITDEELKNSEIFWIDKNMTEENSRISCFDNVEYNFKDMVDALGTTKRVLTYIDVPSGTATIRRKCWVGKNATAPTINSVFEEYKEADIKLKVTADKYKFNITSKDDLSTKEPSSYEYPAGSGAHIYTYSLDLNYSVKTDGSPIRIRSKESKVAKGAYLQFNSGLFGVDSKLFSTARNQISFIDSGSTEDEDISDDARKCYFDMNFISGSIQFRTISLENPFPARDGTSRLPGKNWLYEDNFVFDYITNNRGVRYAYAKNHGMFSNGGQSCSGCSNITFFTDENADYTGKINVSPESIYNEVEPLYTVTLTPSVMIKIRGYNKQHQYTSMYLSKVQDSTADSFYSNGGLTVSDYCVDGKQCYSPFLRNEEYFPAGTITGTCYMDSDGEVYSPEKLHNYITTSTVAFAGGEDRVHIHLVSGDYSGTLDFNKNLIIDGIDETVSRPENEKKLTRFYWCADKTYYSGGPVSRPAEEGERE